MQHCKFLDCDGIDNVTLRKLSDFCSRHTVGVAGDDIVNSKMPIIWIIIVFLGYKTATKRRSQWITLFEIPGQRSTSQAYWVTLALICNIANFWDCDGIDNVTLRKLSDFCSRHTVGVAGDDIMFHILVELERRSKAQNVGNANGYLSGLFNFRCNFR